MTNVVLLYAAFLCYLITYPKIILNALKSLKYTQLTVFLIFFHIKQDITDYYLY